jgi:transcriptional regulator with XRE-family HTH domain
MTPPAAGSLAERLRGARAVRGLTQAGAAAQVGVDVTTWARWEAGRPPRGLYRVAVENWLGGAP